MVKTSPSKIGGEGVIPDQGAKMPFGQKKKKKQNTSNRSNIVTNSTLKNKQTNKNRLNGDEGKGALSLERDFSPVKNYTKDSWIFDTSLWVQGLP